MAFTPGQVLTAAQMNALEAATLPTGAITMYGPSSAPTGYLLCDGAAVNRTTYAALFTAIGTTYGAGNGTTTFNVPNLKGRVPVGIDSGDASFDVLGETGGAKTHTLTTSEMPVHTHTQDAHTHIQDSHFHKISDNKSLVNGGSAFPTVNYNGLGEASNTNSATATNQNATATNQDTGGGSAHNNLQPYIVLNFIIKT